MRKRGVSTTTNVIISKPISYAALLHVSRILIGLAHEMQRLLLYVTIARGCFQKSVSRILFIELPRLTPSQSFYLPLTLFLVCDNIVNRNFRRHSDVLED